MESYLSPFCLLAMYSKLNELFKKYKDLSYYSRFRKDPRVLKILNRYTIPNHYYYFLWQDLRNCTKEDIVLSFHKRLDDSKKVPTFSNFPQDIENQFWTKFINKIQKDYSFNSFRLDYDEKQRIYTFRSSKTSFENIEASNCLKTSIRHSSKIPYHKK